VAGVPQGAHGGGGERERRRLRLDEFTPRVLSSFVRNKLINEVYLPLVGDNLAKQLGAAGAAKRTDLMGLLLLVSPPGYGKTTLMEYVASKLGLVFVKVNGPSLGHSVVSLDPAEAPNATARQEVEKINLALEMGNNVMLYLDDIQHTTPSCSRSSSRSATVAAHRGRVEGRTRTYDLRGKKFCVVMAGNPYTETGASFRIPDMLANRADTYNLGDILGAARTPSRCRTSRTRSPPTPRSPRSRPATPRPLQAHPHRQRARRCPRRARTTYSAVGVAEITSVLRHLFTIQRPCCSR
jgi:hypothetical protein